MKKLDSESGYQACQIHSVHRFSKAFSKNEEQGMPIQRKIKGYFKRHLGLNFIRAERKYIGSIMAWWNNSFKKRKKSIELEHASAASNLKAGDFVRVRSNEEIRRTLNNWNELKGCAFIDEMAEYCGTTQRILKPVERFVDERDYQPKKVRGIFLLEGVICNGTAYYGKCDRSCLFFWREEWLEKVT